MGLLGTALAAVEAVPAQGAVNASAAVAASRPPASRTEGVTVAITRDLLPVPVKGMAGGQLLEAWAILDEQHALDATSKILIRVIEDDTFSDDLVETLVGTGATAPAEHAVQCTTVHATVPTGRDLAWLVEEHKRTHAAYEATILVVTERPAPAALADRRCTHVIAWVRLWHDDTGNVSELKVQLDVEDGGAFGTSPTIEIGPAIAGTAVRLTGRIGDADQTGPAPLPDGLPDVPAALAGRRAVTGESGVFVLDVRLAVGTHPMSISRSGVVGRDLSVEVTAAPPGHTPAFRVRVLDGITEVAASPAPAAPAAVPPGPVPEPAVVAPPIAVVISDPLRFYVHTARGTVLWPDSRRTTAPSAFRRTPLALRTVYALPLPDHADIAPHRPKTTAEWLALKHRPGVLRSARPGRQRNRERTAADGRFELRYFDLSPGKRYLLWVERAVGDGTGAEPDVFESIVRTEEIGLRRMTAPSNQPQPAPGLDDQLMARLQEHTHAGSVESDRCLIIDHEYNVTRDAVSRGPDAVRIEEYGAQGGLRLVRPTRRSRSVFDAPRATVGPAAPPPELSDVLSSPVQQPNLLAPVGPVRFVDFDLHVLPLVVFDEQEGASARHVASAEEALASMGRTLFPGGYDLSTINVAVDVRDFRHWIAIDAPAGDASVAAGWTPHEPAAGARVVKCLEHTLVLRRDAVMSQFATPPVASDGTQSAAPRVAWWFDAVSLADCACVTLPGGPSVGTRTLGEHGVVPLFSPIAPRLPSVRAAPGVFISPGHGLYPSPAASVLPAQWTTTRGGWAANASEDENTGMIGRWAIILLRAAGGRVHRGRAVEDLGASGVQIQSPSSFPVENGRDFPRIWQQNSVYTYGFEQTGRVVEHDNWNANWGKASDDKNSDGWNARAAHVRSLALGGAISIGCAIHTNGSAAPPAKAGEYSLAMYLDVRKRADADKQANTLNLNFATRIQARMAEVTGMAQRVTTQQSTSIAIEEMNAVVDHWAVRTSAEWKDATRLSPSGGTPPTNAEAGVAAAVEKKDLPFPLNAVFPFGYFEVAFHDNPEHARLLRRQWFRLKVGAVVALAIEDQLQAATASLGFGEARAILESLFGTSDGASLFAVGTLDWTDPLALARPTSAPLPTAQELLDTIHAVVGAELTPAAIDQPPATINQVSGFIRVARDHAARAVRQHLFHSVRTAVQGKAGWLGTESAAVLSEWVAGPLLGHAELERPADIATRREAGALAARAAALVPAGGHAPGGLDLAQTVAVGSPRAALIDAVTGQPDALFTSKAADALLDRLATVPVEQLHRVSRVRLLDGGWGDLPRAATGYAVHRGTPLTLSLDTVGVPWKTANHDDADQRLADVEIVVTRGSAKTTLGCALREPSRVASRLWVVDLPPTAGPQDLTVELRLKHRSAGIGGTAKWLSAGSVTVPLHVLPTPPA